MVSSAVEEGRHRCLLLERLVQALETNRVLLQRRASRAEARALRAEAELHALQRTVFSVAATQRPPAQRPPVGAPVAVGPASVSSSTHATPPPRCIGKSPASLLSPRLLLHVFSFLDPHTLVHQVVRVCRRWRGLVNEPTLWDGLMKHHPSLTPPRTPRQDAQSWAASVSVTPVPGLQLTAGPGLLRARALLSLVGCDCCDLPGC